MLKKKHYKKRIVNKKKQTKNKNKNKNIIKVNVNTSTSGGSGSTSIPYPIYPVAQQMFPTNTPPNVYNVFTKDPVKSTYEPQTENVKETENVRLFTSPRQLPRRSILVPSDDGLTYKSDDGITFSENRDSQIINFDNNPPPNLTSQLVVSRTPLRLREQIREAGEIYQDDEDNENDEANEIEKRREYQRRWRQENRDKIREYNAKSRQNKKK